MSGADTGGRHALILVPRDIDPEAPKIEGECSIALFDPDDQGDFEHAVARLRERAFGVPFRTVATDAEQVWRTYVVVSEGRNGTREDVEEIRACGFLWVEDSDTNEVELHGDDNRVVGYFRYVTAVYEKQEEA